MSVQEVLALLVVAVAAPLTWFVAWRLWRLSRLEPRLRVLRAHAVAALALALIVTTFAFIFVNNGLKDPIFNTAETQLITRGMLLVISVASAVYWLRITRRMP